MTDKSPMADDIANLIERLNSGHDDGATELLMRETVAALEALQQRAEKAERRGDNHAETLRAIARMNPATEADRMQLWARDGLSGCQPLESTLLALSNERNALKARAAVLEDALRYIRQLICEGAVTGFNPMDGDWAEKLYASQAISHRALSTPTTAPGFECAARRQGTAGGNDPVDCDWPTCGCDPYADKVIVALEESGALTTAPAEQSPASVAETQGAALTLQSLYEELGMLKWSIGADDGWERAIAAVRAHIGEALPAAPAQEKQP